MVMEYTVVNYGNRQLVRLSKILFNQYQPSAMYGPDDEISTTIVRLYLTPENRSTSEFFPRFLRGDNLQE